MPLRPTTEQHKAFADALRQATSDGSESHGHIECDRNGTARSACADSVPVNLYDILGQAVFGRFNGPPMALKNCMDD